MRGPTVWSFRGNFASSASYAKRFGPVWTTFATRQLMPQQGTLWCGEVVARNGFV